VPYKEEKPTIQKNGGYWFLDQGGATPVMRA